MVLIGLSLQQTSKECRINAQFLGADGRAEHTLQDQGEEADVEDVQ